MSTMSEKKSGLDKAALTLGNLNVIGEESEDEGREDEIKELLAHAFSVETIGDEDEEGQESADDEADSGVRRNVLDINAGGDRHRDTVSLFHGSHCPTAEGDRNGNYDGTWTPDGETLQELKTVAEFRERQAQRAEERVEVLSKEKRALAHQLALLKTEALGMKSTEDELRKTINLKEEQNEFLKEKLNEVLRQFEGAKKSENETKDHNLRLQSQIEKLQQEVKLLSAIGLSTKEADLNDALRQTRQKHATEISVWRDKVAELELTIQKHERLGAPRNHEQEVKPSNQAQTQTSFDIHSEVNAERDRHTAEKELWMRHLASLEGRLQDLMIRRQDCKSVQVQTIEHPKQTQGNNTTPPSSRKPRSSEHVHVQTEDTVATSNISNTQRTSGTTEVQTEETMETYKILGALIESWVVEVTEAEERAVKSETQVVELTKGLRTLKVRFKMLKKLVMVCRKEWSIRENALIQRWNASEERFRNFLGVLGESFAAIDFSPPTNGKIPK